MRIEDVVAQLGAALSHGFGQCFVELVECGGSIVLAFTQCHLSGSPIVADGDVGIDPVVGLPPAHQQLVGALQIGFVDGVAAGHVVVELALHGVDALIEGLLADLFVAAPDQRQCLVGPCLLGGDRQVGDGLE
ncbi:Uncharacterised protein [Mycobacterium tuberculosis]|uniref:Uncharacterized protein n=1 Tax=Mycobacterium tuberculosis TaxID=1773 RepID=A0A655EZJ3_MYCTX|nr:Uncharacterised protein [Mycobacterium tuberculosis]CNV41559.1 Uncharacterised protein [Mycobacterium tuberculosis]